MPNKNQPLKFQQENTKRRKRRMKIALIVGALVVSVGGGIGIAYAIWYTKYANNNDNVLDIKNASDLKANVGRFCATESLTCTTKTGKSVNDAIYSARDLPEGFSIDSKSGVVGGVPKTEGSYNYTIQVTSDAHPTANGKISKKLDVGPAQAQSLTISGAEALNGTVNADFSKTLTLSCKDDLGDEITGVNYTIEGLPVGLTWDLSGSSITITGVVANRIDGTYTIKAETNNLNGSITMPYVFADPAPTNLEIIGAESFNGYKNTQQSSSRLHCETNTGVAVDDSSVAYSISDESLPAGLSFSGTTGVISGTPTVEQTQTAYTITATANVGQTSLTGTTSITITIGPEIPTSLKIAGQADIEGTVGTSFESKNALTCTTNTDADPGTVIYSISNNLQNIGFSIGTDGKINGTPNTEAFGTYTITATATVGGKELTGSVSAAFNFTHGENSPTSLTIFHAAPIATTVGTPVSTSKLSCATNTGTAVDDSSVTYSISGEPSLQSIGLEFDDETGVISGTPTAEQSSTEYTITATDSQTSLTGTTSITITIEPKLPTLLNIIGAEDISGDVSTDIIPTSSLNCTTDAPTTILEEVSYSVSDLPTGLSIDSNTGIITGQVSSEAFGTYTITATAITADGISLTGSITKSYSIGQSIPPVPTVNARMDIKGPRDLAVPYQSSYHYECAGGTLVKDGDWPEGFTFNDNTLTFNGNTPTTFGTFRLKALANDDSGKINVITITYYPVATDFIAANSCAFLYTNGEVEQKTNIISNNILTLSPSGDEQKILKAVYFGTLNGVTSIGDSFLSNCTALTTVDLTQFGSVTTIGNNFLSNCPAIAFVDLEKFTDSLTAIHDGFLSNCNALTAVELLEFTAVTTIGADFISNCKGLTFIDLGGLTNATTIGDSFLSNCPALTYVDLSKLTSVTSIGDDFLANCTALTSVDLKAFKKPDNQSNSGLTNLGDNFLKGCSALSYIDLSPLNGLTAFGDHFLDGCAGLAYINLSGLSNITAIGSDFLANCTALTEIDLSSLTATTTFSTNFMSNCFTLSLIKLGASSFSPPHGAFAGVINSVGTLNRVSGTYAANFIANHSNISNWKVA